MEIFLFLENQNVYLFLVRVQEREKVKEEGNFCV